MQLGHQAINCTNGTINWKQIYGEESFKLKAPVYPSEYDAVAKAKQVDVEKLKKLAEQWKNVGLLKCIPTVQSIIIIHQNHSCLMCPRRSCRASAAPCMRHLKCKSAAFQSLQYRERCKYGGPLKNPVHAGSCQRAHASSWRWRCENSARRRKRVCCCSLSTSGG